MNVCAFVGGKTTEHESFSAQRNAGQGTKHLKKEVSFNFLILEKNLFQINIRFACCGGLFGVVHSELQLRRSRAGFHCNAMFIYVIFPGKGLRIPKWWGCSSSRLGV